MFLHHLNYKPLDYIQIMQENEPCLAVAFITNIFGACHPMWIIKDQIRDRVYANVNTKTAFKIMFDLKKDCEGFITIFDACDDATLSQSISKTLTDRGETVFEISGGEIDPTISRLTKFIINVQFYPGTLLNKNYNLDVVHGGIIKAQEEGCFRNCVITTSSNAVDRSTLDNPMRPNDFDNVEEIDTCDLIANVNGEIDEALGNNKNIVVIHTEDSISTFLQLKSKENDINIMNITVKPSLKSFH